MLLQGCSSLLQPVVVSSGVDPEPGRGRGGAQIENYG